MTSPPWWLGAMILIWLAGWFGAIIWITLSLWSVVCR